MGVTLPVRAPGLATGEMFLSTCPSGGFRVIIRPFEVSRQGNAPIPWHAKTYPIWVVFRAIAWFNDPMPEETTELNAIATLNGSDDALLESGLPPRSTVALLGFILALVFLVPWVWWLFLNCGGTDYIEKGGQAGMAGGVLAALLGIIGIFRTKRRIRRGRGLAIAAIPIGVVGAFFQITVALGVDFVLGNIDFGNDAVTILKTPQAEITERAQEWYSQRTSKSFQTEVSVEKFESWLSSIIEERGQMQSFKINPRGAVGIKGTRGAVPIAFQGKFVSGSTSVVLLITMDGTDRKVNDILVGGASPRNYAK